MATVIEMGIIVKDGAFPSVTIEDRWDAQTFVQILSKIGVDVNLRETRGRPSYEDSIAGENPPQQAGSVL